MNEEKIKSLDKLLMMHQYFRATGCTLENIVENSVSLICMCSYEAGISVDELKDVVQHIPELYAEIIEIAKEKKNE